MTMGVGGAIMVAVAVTAVLGVVALGLWAGREHSRRFPRGWDRTGWDPVPGVGGRFRTMYTWLSGGRS
jgi:hypothetical protein